MIWIRNVKTRCGRVLKCTPRPDHMGYQQSRRKMIYRIRNILMMGAYAYLCYNLYMLLHRLLHDQSAGVNSYRHIRWCPECPDRMLCRQSGRQCSTMTYICLKNYLSLNFGPVWVYQMIYGYDGIILFYY